MARLLRAAAVFRQDPVDNLDKRIELRTANRLAASIPRRNRKPQHLLNSPAINPENTGSLASAHALDENRSPDPSIQFHALHPRPLPKARRLTLAEFCSGQQPDHPATSVADFCTGVLIRRQARPHPVKLVPSAAMASVAPFRPSYRPMLPAAVPRDGHLEKMIPAGGTHGAYSAGSGCRRGGGSVSAAKGGDSSTARFRRGFILGEGTRVGNGRWPGFSWTTGAGAVARRSGSGKKDKLPETIADAWRDRPALG